MAIYSRANSMAWLTISMFRRVWAKPPSGAPSAEEGRSDQRKYCALGRTHKTWATGKRLVIVGMYPV